uniref:Uncharacterized protein n=1 Tax=Daphnia magna TaxID=35525 RepID=A0A0P6FNT2_9CRUS
MNPMYWNTDVSFTILSHVILPCQFRSDHQVLPYPVGCVDNDYPTPFQQSSSFLLKQPTHIHMNPKTIFLVPKSSSSSAKLPAL